MLHEINNRLRRVINEFQLSSVKRRYTKPGSCCREGGFDSKVLPLGRAFDIKKGKNVKSPWVCPAPLPWGLTLTGALTRLASRRATKIKDFKNSPVFCSCSTNIFDIYLEKASLEGLFTIFNFYSENFSRHIFFSPGFQPKKTDPLADSCGQESNSGPRISLGDYWRKTGHELCFNERGKVTNEYSKPGKKHIATTLTGKKLSVVDLLKVNSSER